MVLPLSFCGSLSLVSEKNRKRANMAKFEKGKSGNPSGRPKLPPGVMTRAEAAAALAALVPDAIEAIAASLRSGDEKVRMRAAEIVLERHLGKIAEAQPAANDEGKVDTVDFVPAVVSVSRVAE
jgi:hypothetical protein